MTSNGLMEGERRRRRSEEPEVAVGYQLMQVVREFGLECCLIADESGRVVSAAPDRASPLMRSLGSLLPAMAMLPGSRDAHLRRLQDHRPELSGEEVTCCVFRAGGRRLYIAALGPEAVMNEVAIFRAILGARRIHREIE
jgi:hypothetical protein